MLLVAPVSDFDAHEVVAGAGLLRESYAISFGTRGDMSQPMGRGVRERVRGDDSAGVWAVIY